MLPLHAGIVMGGKCSAGLDSSDVGAWDFVLVCRSGTWYQRTGLDQLNVLVGGCHDSCGMCGTSELSALRQGPAALNASPVV